MVAMGVIYPTCELDENRRLREARETLMNWIITLEALSAQEDNLY
jgi:hypothetical protein